MVVVYIYGGCLIAWFVAGLLKGSLHFKYVNFDEIKAGEDISFIDAFGFDTSRVLDQRYVLPYLPKKNHDHDEEKRMLYGKVVKLFWLLIVLYLVVLSPAVVVLIGY